MMNDTPRLRLKQGKAKRLRYGWVAGWLWLMLSLIVACSSNQPLPNPLATPTPVAVITPTATPLVPLDIKTASATEQQLVIWAPDFFEAKPDANTGNILQAVYRQFEQANPGVHIDVHIKAEIGEASLFNYLRSAQRVAPTILPDLILVDTQYLWQAAELDLVHPLTSTELLKNVTFYPFALNAVTFKQQPYAIPYTADLVHAVYDSKVYTNTPATWDTLLAAKQPYLFPAGTPDSFYNESLLLQYVGAGGQLTENGELSNPEALKALFTFLMHGRANGVISDSVLTLSSLSSAWSAFMTTHAGVTNVSAHLYLSQPKAQEDIAFGPVPLRNGQNVTMARTWAFAILTNDPVHRQLALRLISNLLDPAIQGHWSQLANYLPTTPAAWTAWTNSNQYQEFLQQELEVAVAIPSGRPFAEFAKQLQDVQQAVLQGKLSPQDALKQFQTKP